MSGFKTEPNAQTSVQVQTGGSIQSRSMQAMVNQGQSGVLQAVARQRSNMKAELQKHKCKIQGHGQEAG